MTESERRALSSLQAKLRVEANVLREVASRIHWDACGKPASEQSGYYAALAIVNDAMHRRGERRFGE